MTTDRRLYGVALMIGLFAGGLFWVCIAVALP